MIFDYKCIECGNEEEKYVSSSAQAVECPKCGALMSRQLSAPGEFICKGTMGFYKSGNNLKK